jgi:hypothetical protein
LSNASCWASSPRPLKPATVGSVSWRAAPPDSSSRTSVEGRPQMKGGASVLNLTGLPRSCVIVRHGSPNSRSNTSCGPIPFR